jgi:ketosteroid isomerase-like protein
MSQENVEIVLERFLATAGGDPAGAQGFWDDSIEWDMSGVAGWPEKQVYRGSEEVASFLRAWADSWQEWHFDVDEVRDAGADKVFAAIHERGIGAGTGATVEQRRYFALGLREGRAVSVEMGRRAQGRRAAGLASSRVPRAACRDRTGAAAIVRNTWRDDLCPRPFNGMEGLQARGHSQSHTRPLCRIANPILDFH